MAESIRIRRKESHQPASLTPEPVSAPSTLDSVPERAIEPTASPVGPTTAEPARPEVRQGGGGAEHSFGSISVLPRARPEADGRGGQRLPEGVQEKFETAFDHDFSSVRVHQSSNPQAVNALAYTQGSDIHFAPGLYAPDTQPGQELLGHELTHVVQQSQGRVGGGTQHRGFSVNDDHGLEREADQLGAKAAHGESVYRSGIGEFQRAHSTDSIREGQGRVLGLNHNQRDASGVVQCYGGFAPKTGRKVTTLKGATGDWTVKHGLVTAPTDTDDGEYEIDIDLKLNEAAKDSKNVRFVQTVRRGTTPGNWATKATDPGMGEDRAARAAEGGWRVDRADPSGDKTPFYGHNMGGKGGTLQNTSTATPGQFGGSLVHLWDKPAVSDPSVLEFSTNALDETSGVTYGSVGWGFQYSKAASTYIEETPRLLADGDSRLAGQAAAYKKWNEVYGPSGTRDKNVNPVPIDSPAARALREGNDAVVPAGDTQYA